MGNLKFLGLALLFLSSIASATDLKKITDASENDLYRLDPDTKKFSLVTPGTEEEAKLYVRYSNKYEKWVWCSGFDRRLILDDSKLQGWRLGLPGQRGLNWFRLDKDLANWKKATDRRRPEVFREDQFGRRILVERYPDQWVNWGGELDPIDDKPTCELTPAKAKIFVNEKVSINIKVKGKVDKATVNGTTITAPGDFDVAAGPEGTQTVEVAISGPGGNNICRTQFTVEKPTFSTPVSCELLLDKAQVAVDQPVNVKLKSTGAVKKAYLEGQEIEADGTRAVTFRTPGEKTVTAVVVGENSSNSCNAKFTVTEGGQTGDKPGCTLRITPKVIQLGEEVLMTLETTGQVNKAEIDGKAVSLPFTQKFKPERVDTFNPQVKVTSPAGVDGFCKGTYEVTQPR